MKKQNIDKTSEWVSELGELVPISFNHETHATKLRKPIKGIYEYVRKPYGDDDARKD